MRSGQSLGAVFKERTVPGIVSVLSPISGLRSGAARQPESQLNDVATASFSLQSMKLAVLSISIRSFL
jgi:hypothetical protein